VQGWLSALRTPTRRLRLPSPPQKLWAGRGASKATGDAYIALTPIGTDARSECTGPQETDRTTLNKLLELLSDALTERRTNDDDIRV
jgi:hypothetical protein